MVFAPPSAIDLNVDELHNILTPDINITKIKGMVKQATPNQLDKLANMAPHLSSPIPQQNVNLPKIDTFNTTTHTTPTKESTPVTPTTNDVKTTINSIVDNIAFSLPEDTIPTALRTYLNTPKVDGSLDNPVWSSQARKTLADLTTPKGRSYVGNHIPTPGDFFKEIINIEASTGAHIEIGAAIDGFVTRILPDLLVRGAVSAINSGILIPTVAAISGALTGLATAIPSGLWSAAIGALNPLNMVLGLAAVLPAAIADALAHGALGGLLGYIGGRILSDPLLRALSTFAGMVTGIIIANILTNIAGPLLGLPIGAVLGAVLSILPNLLTRLIVPIASGFSHFLLGWPIMWAGLMLAALVPAFIAAIIGAFLVGVPFTFLLVGIGLTGFLLIWKPTILAAIATGGLAGIALSPPAVVLTVLSFFGLLAGIIAAWTVGFWLFGIVTWAVLILPAGVVSFVLALTAGLPFGYIMGHITATIINLGRTIINPILGGILGSLAGLIVAQLAKPLTLPLGALAGGLLGFLNPLVNLTSALITGIPGAILGALTLAPLGALKGGLLGFLTGWLATSLLHGSILGLLGFIAGGIPGALLGLIPGAILGGLATFFFAPLVRGLHGDMYNRWNKAGMDDPHNKNGQALIEWWNNLLPNRIIRHIRDLVGKAKEKVLELWRDLTSHGILEEIRDFFRKVTEPITKLGNDLNNKIREGLKTLFSPVIDLINNLLDNLVKAAHLDTPEGRKDALRGAIIGSLLGTLLGAIAGALNPLNLISGIGGALLGVGIGAPLGGLISAFIGITLSTFVTWLATSVIHAGLLSIPSAALGGILAVIFNTILGALLGKFAGNSLSGVVTLGELLTLWPILFVASTALWWIGLVLVGGFALSILPSLLAAASPWITTFAIAFMLGSVALILVTGTVSFFGLIWNLITPFLPPLVDGMVAGFSSLIFAVIGTIIMVIISSIIFSIVMIVPAAIIAAISLTLGLIAFFLTAGGVLAAATLAAPFLGALTASILTLLAAIPLFLINWVIGSILGSLGGAAASLLTAPIAYILGRILGRILGAIAGFTSPLNLIPASIIGMLSALPLAGIGTLLGAIAGGITGATIGQTAAAILSTLLGMLWLTPAGALTGMVIGGVTSNAPNATVEAVPYSRMSAEFRNASAKDTDKFTVIDEANDVLLMRAENNTLRGSVTFA